ncbi:hypothetical protein CVS40_7029 [Lucilia cuprina]|nr:hypothetical protein CVS40_7029 [Lucilia cuprina]
MFCCPGNHCNHTNVKMFRLLATTKCKRQQIAILIISFFAYVAGIRNEGNNMLLQQQETTIENSNYQSPNADIKQPTNSNFRPSQQIIDFTPADAAVPQQYKPTYIEPPQSTISNIAIYMNNNKNNNNNNIQQKQETQNDNRRYTIEAAATYGNVGEKQFSFPNEQQIQQQHIPQHLTDKPIYIYRDPYTNENYHYTPTEANVKDSIATTYNHNNYNNNGYKQQQDTHHYQLHNDDNQEYLVQSSMVVGTHQQQQQQPNPFRPYMSLSDDKDVYLKRPGLVYDDKPSYSHPNSVIDKKSEEEQTLKANKISYDSHDYPPPSYFQQQTSNFLPTPVPTSTSRPAIRPTPPPTPPPRQEFRPTTPTQSTIFNQQPPPQQYLQSSQSTLPNYANNIDNYLLNKQPSSDYYRTELPPPSYLQQQKLQLQYETRPPSYEYDNRPQSLPPPYQQQYQQYESRPPSYGNRETSYPQYETPRPPPPPRPSYNNYYDYQIGEIPPPGQSSLPPSQQFNYPYPRPPPSQYPYQGPYRPPPPPAQQQQSGLATLVQYAPQFTSLLLSGVGGGGGSNTNSPLGSLIGALTGGATAPQTSASSSSSYNRRPVNSQLIKALENIARNDDLQCVPKVLCQMIAAQTQRGQLPTFITSPAITNFLAGFPAASPALIYGRAALLGLSGGEKSCHQTYVKCPKNEYEIIYYLNNHRGGFFKFFSEPDEQQQTNHDSTQQGATSLFSILSALTGTPPATTTTPRPKPKPQAPSADITSGIGNFFTQLLSDYMGGATVEYQRRLKRSLDDKIKFEDEVSEENHRDMIKFEDERREHQGDVLKFKDEDYDNNEESHQNNATVEDEEDFHDEEDNEDTQQGVGFQDDDEQDYDDAEGRILHKNSRRRKRIKFFPEMRETSDEIDKEEELKKIIKKFNEFNRVRKLKFPTSSEEHQYIDVGHEEGLRKGKFLQDNLPYQQQNYGHDYNNYVENTYDDFQKESKKIKFIDDHVGEDNKEQPQSLYSYYLEKPKDHKTKLVFPEREGKILNRPYYAASYLHDYLQEQTQQHQQQQQLEPESELLTDEKFVLSNSQRPLRYSEFPNTSSANVYNTHINSLQSQNSFSSNTAVNNNIYVASSPAISSSSGSNHFLPTPPPDDNDYTAANTIYTNKDYSSNQYNYNSLKQSAFYKPPRRYPSISSASSSSLPSSSSGSNNFYKPQRYYSSSNTPTNFNRYHSSLYTTTRRPYVSVTTTRKSDDKNIYVTNSRGVTEYYITPDGRKVYL